MRRAALLLAIALLPGAARADVFLPGAVAQLSYRSPADGASRDYALRLPATWDGTGRLPAVLFLHGRGGTRRQFQRPEILAEADVRGALLVFWEGRIVPGGIGVPSTHYVDGADGVPDETDVLACLDDALARAPIDPERISLAGFSQGGRGALEVGLLNPSRFAALVSAAGPTDAFQGQLWSPSFPDYLSAAGGPASSGGEVLARWFELSPRFLLPNARNLFVSILHGQADDVVPDATAFFPYRNGHHVSVTPGFADARGRAPTLDELRAADPAGYAFSTSFPLNVGHDQLALLPPAALFDAALGKTRVARPTRVVGVSFGARERTFHWARLGRLSPPDGTPLRLDARADVGANGAGLAFEGASQVRLDLPAAGLDPSRRLELRLAGGPRLDLLLAGAFSPSVVAMLDGATVVPARTSEGLSFTGLVPAGSGSLLVVAPSPPGPVAEGDLLVPALVRADGANGARFRSVLALGNVSAGPVVLEALLLDGSSLPMTVALPASSSRAIPAETLVTVDGPFAAPLRLRVVSGDGLSVAASLRVFNESEAGAYGLSFPVATATGSVLGPGERALLFAPPDSRAERLNVSLFAPFAHSEVEVEVLGAAGAVLRSIPVVLPALRRTQLDDLLAATPAAASVRVRVVSGRVQAYGTAISNSATNDPWRVPALPIDGAATDWSAPAVAAAPGRNGAYFTSDLFLVAPSGASLDATLFPRDGSAPATARLSLAPGEVRVVPDVLASLFPEKVPGAGSLRLASDAPLLPLAVTRSVPPTGPSSQDLPCVPAGAEAAPGRAVAFSGVDETAAARSNLVLASTGGPARVRLRLLAPDGPKGERVVDLGAGRVAQLDSFAALFAPGGVEGATLVVSPESGSVVASLARIDNATNDPAGLAPVPVGGR